MQSGQVAQARFHGNQDYLRGGSFFSAHLSENHGTLSICPYIYM